MVGATDLDRNNNFDLIRLFAALEVAIVHAIVSLELGDDPFALHVLPGVPIFFFISGYLIFQSYGASKSIGRYAAKRALRIYPALYVCFALCVLTLAIIGLLTNVEPLRLAVWSIAQLTVAQFYNPDFLRSFGTGALNGSLWTISVELQFYCVTPLLYGLVKRWPIAWLPLIAIFALANVAFSALHDGSTVAKLAMVTFVPWYFMFMLGAWVSTRPAIVASVVRSPLWAVGGLFAAVSVATWQAGLPVGTNSINPVMFATLGALILKVAYTEPTLAGRLLRGNDLSYGIYIYHMPVFNLLLWLGLGSSLLYGLAGLAIVALLAAASWFLVERPALRLRASGGTGPRAEHSERELLPTAGP